MQFPNIPLLRKTVEWVEAQAKLAEEKREWNQGSWYVEDPAIIAAKQDINDPVCGTAMCFAGKVAHDAGWIPIFDDSNGELRYASEATKGGKFAEIERIAIDELGIDIDQAEDLFSVYNDAERIRTIAEEIAGERL